MADPAPDAWATSPDMRAIFDALRALQPQGRRYRTTESTGQPTDRPRRVRLSTGPLRTLLDELVVTYRRVADKHGLPLPTQLTLRALHGWWNGLTPEQQTRPEIARLWLALDSRTHVLAVLDGIDRWAYPKAERPTLASDDPRWRLEEDYTPGDVLDVIADMLRCVAPALDTPDALFKGLTQVPNQKRSLPANAARTHAKKTARKKRERDWLEHQQKTHPGRSYEEHARELLKDELETGTFPKALDETYQVLVKKSGRHPDGTRVIRDTEDLTYLTNRFATLCRSPRTTLRRRPLAHA